MVSCTAWVQVHIFVEPLDLPGIARVAVVADLAGAEFGVWQAQERRGAQITNGPGAWSMSVLNPSGMKGAKESYGEVFGWNADAMGEMTLWRLPSYVRGRPGQPVPRDVVGVMVPANNEQPRATLRQTGASISGLSTLMQAPTRLWSWTARSRCHPLAVRAAGTPCRPACRAPCSP